MAREDLIGALINAVERGETLDEAKRTLTTAGYASSDVEEAAAEVGRLMAGKTKALKKPSAKPKRGFPWLILILTVVAAAVAAFFAVKAGIELPF